MRRCVVLRMTMMRQRRMHRLRRQRQRRLSSMLRCELFVLHQLQKLSMPHAICLTLALIRRLEFGATLTCSTTHC